MENRCNLLNHQIVVVEMALASTDALGALSHLQTNLPSWIARVSGLAVHTSARHAKYTGAYRRHASYKLLRRKNGSLCSIHTNKLAPISEAIEAVTPTTVGDASLLAQTAGRKRGADEAQSIDSSERHAFVSTLRNVIIEYDGHTQKVLEEVVRNIGIARNNIRRGKMRMMSRGGLRSALLNRTAVGGGQPGETRSSLPAVSCVRSTRTGGGIVVITRSSGIGRESSFGFIDKQLELANRLCETAAYQILRSGECGTELDGVLEKFNMLLEMTNNEIKRLQEENKQQEEEAKTQIEAQSQSTEEDPSAKPSPTPTAERLARVAAIAAGKPATTAPGTIEVDEASSISAESIDLSAFRSSRIRV